MQILCKISNYRIILAIGVLLSSCSVLTKSQLQLVNNVTIVSDSVVSTPSVIFKELSTIRTERGLYYAASLTTAAAREKEINALVTSAVEDEKIVVSANTYINVINSYLRALRSISAEARWKSYGTEWRGIGRNVDSLWLRVNKTGLIEYEIPVGWANLSGQYAGYMSENYMRLRQAKTVRAFVTEGDTLIAACVDGLVKLLKEDGLIELIDNEEKGLKSNYEAYLYRLELSEQMPDISYDRQYIALSHRMLHVKKTRTRCITALQSFKRAHHKLVNELEKRKKINYVYEELLELNALALQLNHMLK
ncbi:MAG: hypothetical protein LBQ60_09530 [Bacteroidales bacterium]|nr:hypothetical protein [Bacteroidales bacterium]